MAPILSKPAAKSHENAWFAILCGKVVEQAKEVARDLVEVTNYLKKCMTFDTQLHLVAAGFSQYFGCWTLMSLHNLICQFTAGRAERQSSEEEPEIQRIRLVDFMPPAFIAWIMAILYSSFVFVYLPCAGLSLASPVSMAFHAMMAMVLTTYYKAAVTDPGTIPASITWRTFGRPPACLKDRKKSGEARWCRKSEAYKPDRSHYCSATERCVLRMDHYCPWLNNTVGYANHKFFLQFLVYSSSACLLGTIKTVGLLASMSLPPTTVLMLVEAGAIGALLSGILIPFTTFHCWLLCNNMTTIEFCEYRFSPDRERTLSRHRYDMGLYNNLASVLGGNPLLWLLPVGAPLGNGLSFPMRLEDDSKELDYEGDEGSTTASDGHTAPTSAGDMYASDWTVDDEPRTAVQQSDTAEGDLAGAVVCGCTLVRGILLDAATRISRICSTDHAKRTCAAAGHCNRCQESEESSMEDGYSSDGSEQSILSARILPAGSFGSFL